MKVFAEVSDDGKWIEIFFKFNPVLVNKMHGINAIFRGPNVAPDGIPFWRIPLDFEEAKRLTDKVGRDNLEFGDAITEWGKQERTRQEAILEVRDIRDPKLTIVPKKLPKMYRKMKDYQKEAVYFGAFTDHLLIGDQPGLGKTWEDIGLIFESGLGDGQHLVVAPLTAIESVWLAELTEYQPHPVFVAADAGMGRNERLQILGQARDAMDADLPFWLVVNPHMVSFKREGAEMDEENITRSKLVPRFPFLHEVEWTTVTLDEPHKGGVRNVQTVTAQGMFALKVKSDGVVQTYGQEGGKRIALSGTPMGGRPVNLYGILHYLRPDVFTSKWRWVKQWLTFEETNYGMEIGDVKGDRVEAFQRHLAPYIIRRTKEEVLKELPPIQHIDVWCDMTGTQAGQYRMMAKQAKVRIGESEMSATGILALYTRLKQFADARQELEPTSKTVPIGDSGLTFEATNTKLLPKSDSGKLMALEEKLSEFGIMDDTGDQQAVIGTQFTEIAYMLYDYFVGKGVRCLLLTGRQNRKGERAELKRSFQDGEARLMIMNTMAGGLAITLDRADTVHIFDETWNPDDQEQLEDRCHRASRIHQVTSYTYRSRKTIEEYIRKVNAGKRLTNKMVLDSARTLKLYEGDEEE